MAWSKGYYEFDIHCNNQISCCLEVAAMRSSRVEKSPMPSAGARTERRENHPADFLFALALCSVHFLKLPQD